MLFSSIPFLYYFLPAVILTYFFLPMAVKLLLKPLCKRDGLADKLCLKLRNAILLVSSLVFYGWGEPKLLTLMVFTIVLFYGCGLAIGWCKRTLFRRLWLIVSIVISVALLGFFKYADFFVDTFNSVTGLSIPLLRLALPVGISFYTFQCLSYTIDVYRGNVASQKDPISFGAYVALFPQLIAGPIVRYIDVARELDSRTHSWDGIALGLRRFLMGLAKKVIIADNFALLMKLFRESDQPSVLFYWMYAIAFMLNIYFDFSGYSDMAIGLGRVFGFNFIENFNYPYLSKSVAEFWRRWHMSLGSWFRDYIYIPLGGNRVSKARWFLNTLTVWALTGLWHGAAWNFVLWGLMFAALLLIEKFVPALQKLPSFFRHVYVLFLIMISFVLFNAESLTQAGTDIIGLFGLTGAPLVTKETLYYLGSYAVLFVMGILGATPLVKNTGLRLNQTKVGAIMEPLVLIILLLICTGYLVDGSFSPFLYFRF
ncbi:MAG: MBOAT family protein [Oscillospiraceae bacterium]|nr:MBOAT family protein [Oscillospiraceae bacterium]